MPLPIIDTLRQTAHRHPDKIAIRDGEQRIPFATLWQQALLLGQALVINGEHQRGDEEATRAGEAPPIVVHIPKSIAAVVAMAGIQLSGRVYVPFDTDNPPERRQRMLARLGAHGLLTWKEGIFYLDQEPLTTSTPPLPDPEDFPALEARLFERLQARSDSAILYVMFTSGTTGLPKGVAITNRSTRNYIDWVAATYQVTDQEIIGNQSPIFFDHFTFDMFLTFQTGCTLHLIPPLSFRFPGALIDYLLQHRISLIFFVPAVYTHLKLLDLLKGIDAPHLKKLLFAGEAMPLSTIHYLHTHLPHALLSNLYGPTEATVDVVSWIFGDELNHLKETPLGLPCAGARIVLMAENGEIFSEPEKVGEICIGGPGLSPGYWNDPETSRQRFIPSPEPDHPGAILYRTGDLGYWSAGDGLLYMVGRKDHQFKHLGHRIEPGEIEKALLGFPGVSQALVHYNREKRQIEVFLASRQDPNPQALRHHLNNWLPPYMMPGRIVSLEKLPTTPNGKVDRAALGGSYSSSISKLNSLP
ncbi:MAG: amino acid adenylation domain-containing protein [Magnetococcales bacterium]|nr:amino acid adenylation domain-containing protein [Magnetococcales bacterium]